MLGRVRASSISSLELLEMERPPSKITKHDSLSIYESTLLKLKQGSHCNPTNNPEEPSSANASCIMSIDSPEEAMTTDADFSSKEQSSKNMSILHFFSKCKNSQHANNSNNKEVMVIESGCFSSTTSSG
ncbi:hypothetical protein ACS0TY_034882 [Phlomoides rotata]